MSYPLTPTTNIVSLSDTGQTASWKYFHFNHSEPCRSCFVGNSDNFFDSGSHTTTFLTISNRKQRRNKIDHDLHYLFHVGFLDSPKLLDSFPREKGYVGKVGNFETVESFSLRDFSRDLNESFSHVFHSLFAANI